MSLFSLALTLTLAGQASPSAEPAPPPDRPSPPDAHTPAPSTIGPTPARRPSEQTSRPPPASNDDVEALEWIVDINSRVARAVKRIKSTECEFYKEEWKNKKELAPSRATLKHRRRGDVFLDFAAGPNAGRHILFRPGKNGGKLLVSNPLMNLSLDPGGFLAMRNNRHTIDKAGVLNVADTIVRDYKRLSSLEPSAASYEKLGRRKVAGEWTRCYRSSHDKKRYPDLFAAKTEICVSERTGLPIEVKVWQHEGGQLRRVGLYRYTKCKVNKLTDRDFDPDNPDYQF